MSATDSGSATTNGSFTVRVQDTIAPTVAPHLDVTVDATSVAGAVVICDPASADDAVGVSSITYSQDSGTNFPIGMTTVTITARDAANNEGTGSFTVTVNPLPSAPASVVRAGKSSALSRGDRSCFETVRAISSHIKPS